MKKTRAFPLLAAALVAALSSCGDEAPPALAVGPVTFTENQLLGLSRERRQALADLTGFALAVSDSALTSLGAPRVEARVEDRLLDLLAAELTLERHGVGNDVLEARYLTDPDYELTVRHILFFSERWRPDERRAAARAKAERALEALRGGADFAETAARLSEEPGAEGRQGLLTPGREGAWVDEFWAAASALDVGEISPVTETQYGFHILRLEGREVVPFAEARNRIALEVADRLEDPRAVLDAFLDAGPEIFVAEDVVEASSYDTFGPTALLATWEGGRITFDDYRRWSVTRPASWEDGGLGSDEAAFRASILELARRRIALAEAQSRGLSVAEATRERIARDWADTATRWATVLGFRRGASPERVAEAALAALAATGQGAVIARNELLERAPLVRAAYPATLSDPVG